MTINWKKNLFFVWISQFLAMVGFGCCMPFIPLLLQDNLHVADEHVRGVCVSAYYMTGMVSLCVASIVWGILADRYGRKLMLLRASYAAGLLYPLLAFAPNFATLLLIRFVCSFFSGTVNPAQTLLVTTTPKEKHGFVLGTLSTAIWSGNMAGYLIGGLIVHYFGYITAFLTCGAVYLLGGALVHIFVDENFKHPVLLPEDKRKKKKKKESFTQLVTPGILWLLGLFLLMGIARRIEQPFVAMLVQVIHGKDGAAFFTGIVSAVAALGGVISGILVGRMCDRYSPWKLIIPVLIASGVASLAQAFSQSIIMLAVTRFFAYMAAGGIQPILQVILTRIIKPELRGTYFGWTNGMSQSGGIICSLMSASIAWCWSIRGIFITGGLLLLLMVPMMIPAIRICRKEEALREQDS